MGSSQWYEKPARGPAAVQGDRPTPAGGPLHYGFLPSMVTV